MTLPVLLSTFRSEIPSHLYQNLLIDAFQVQILGVEQDSSESLFGPQSQSLETLGEGKGYWTRFHIHISEVNPLLIIEIGEFVRPSVSGFVAELHEQARFEIAAKVQLSRFEQMPVKAGKSCRVSGIDAYWFMGRGLFATGADDELVGKYIPQPGGHEKMTLLDEKKRVWCDMRPCAPR